jgi:hypothetical protein
VLNEYRDRRGLVAKLSCLAVRAGLRRPRRLAAGEHRLHKIFGSDVQRRVVDTSKRIAGSVFAES